MKVSRIADDPMLFGADPQTGLVAAEWVERKSGADEVELFVRGDAGVETRREPLRAFVVVESPELADRLDAGAARRPLAGRGPLRVLLEFDSWKQCLAAKSRLAKLTGKSPASDDAPYLFIADPVAQHLLRTGRTLFKGMDFARLKRMQVDIECDTTPGYEFCNAEREGDAIIAVAMADETGWTDVLSARDMAEPEMLARFVACVRARDPDVIEGHNIFAFDLPYLAERARRHGVKLALGRDGSAPSVHPSRVSYGERTIAYPRFDIFGRHVIDTLFLAQAYDISHRSLPGYGLKEVAEHFGLSAPDRTHIDGAAIAAAFRADPERVLRYARDDVSETRALSRLLSQSVFAQTQMLPYTYQDASVRGTGVKIDMLMLREYLRRECALPVPGAPRPFEGGYTDVFVQGVAKNVHHCDVASLYPSLMLSRRLAPARDELGVFLRLLDALRTRRLDAKRAMKTAAGDAERDALDAFQSAFKTLINSFYGYLGFARGMFNDYDMAERVTADGRALLKSMIEWLRGRGAVPVEIDTDGIYFVPPALAGERELDAFRQAFRDSLPEGIEIEFDGRYRAMFSYKMKNYALLDIEEDRISITGAALKSRGLEPFQREFLQQAILLLLTGREGEISALKSEYERAIRNREWPVAKLAKTETLGESPAAYQEKVAGKERARSAVYELALKSGRDYRAGDQVSYYVTGTKKNVAAHENARLISDWDPAKRDENVAFYLAKLDALHERFFGKGAGAAPGAQGELF